MKLLHICILASASLSVGAVTREMLRGSSSKTLGRAITPMRVLEDGEDPNADDDDSYIDKAEEDEDENDAANRKLEDGEDPNADDDDSYMDKEEEDENDAANRKLEDGEDPSADDDDSYMSENKDGEDENDAANRKLEDFYDDDDA